MSIKRNASIRGTIKIVGLYLLIGFLWILFSDQLMEVLISDQNVYHKVSIYKGWGYVLVTGVLLYFLIKNHTDQLSAGETWLRMAYNAAEMGTWRHNIESGIVQFDERARVHYGFDSLKVQIGDVVSRVHPDDVSRLEQEIASAVEPSTGGRYTTEYRVIHADGDIHWLGVEAYVSFVGEGEKRRPVFGVGTSRDITASKQAELQSRYFARLYATLSQVNQAIVRSKNQDELFENICKVSVDFGEFRLAWIGLLNEEMEILNLVSECGAKGNKLPFQVFKVSEMPYMEGLVGLALRSGQVEFSNDIQVDSRMAHWSEAAIRGNYHSAAAVPLRKDGRVFGLLNLYAADIGFFMVEEERALLEEMGMDISYALDGFELEKQREQARKELTVSEERFQKAFYSGPVGLAITRASDGVYIDANQAFAELVGFTKEELIGQTSLGLNITTPAQRQDYIKLISQSGAIRDHEMTVRSKSGEERALLGSMEVIELNHEVCVLSTAIDVTKRKQIEELHKRSEKNYQELLEQASDGIFIADAEGYYILVNQAACDLVGYSREEILSMHLRELVAPENLKQHPLRLDELRAGKTLIVDRTFLRKDGTRIECELSAKMLSDGRFQSLVRDVTQRKQAEEKTYESEQRFRQLADNIEEVFWIFDPIGKKEVYISPAFEKIWMRPVNIFFDDPDKFFESIVPEDRAYVRQTTSRQAHGEKTEMRYRISRPDGSIRWVWDRGFPVFDENGKVVRVVAILSDISEQKKAEAELLELNQNLEQRVIERTAEVVDLYENAPAGYHSLNADGLIVRMNQTELDWLGYTREEIVGIKSIDDLIAPQSKKIYSEYFSLFKTQGFIKDIEIEIMRKDGSIIPVLVNGTAIYNKQGEFIMSRSNLVDITERKQAELQLQTANVALEKAAKLKDEFLANMSHELRTPLNAIIGLSESLQIGTYGGLVPQQEKILHVIRESGQHLLELINDILDLSKIEAGMLELQYETIDLKAVCEASVSFVKDPALKKELQISISVTDKIQTIQADKRRLKQMIVNLLSNAVKFTPPYGSMGLEVFPENDHAVRFTVWDTGIGISSEQLENLFKPFVQVDSSLSRKYEGTGLGLALVRQLAEMHNGSIGVESAPGKGSRFYFIIPKQASQDFTDEALPIPSESAIEPIAIPSSAFTILLVEDNPTNMMFTGDYLAAKGFNLVTAENGLQAIEQAELHKPSLILMDIQMPEMDGIETIRRLRSAPKFASVPIIAVTALAMPGDRENCLEAGASEYIAKPISLKKLTEMITHFLS